MRKVDIDPQVYHHSLVYFLHISICIEARYIIGALVDIHRFLLIVMASVNGFLQDADLLLSMWLRVDTINYAIVKCQLMRHSAMVHTNIY